MTILYIVGGIIGSILIPGVYFGIVSAIAITVCKALLKKH